MITYNFDKIVERKNTNCSKYDNASKIFGTDDLKPMWVADMDFQTPDFVINDLKKRLEHEILAYSIQPYDFNESIKNWISKHHQWEIEKKWIQFTPGVVPALAASVMSFTNPGDKIIIQTPVYFPFPTTIANNGRQVVINQLKYENGEYTIDFENFEKNIDSRTKMFMMCNPHNPVGRVWTREELTKLANICLKHNLLIISDEIHADLVMPGFKHIPIASLSPEIANITITTYSASKTFNLAGTSTAVAIISNPELRKLLINKLDDWHVLQGNIFGIIATASAFKNGENWHNQLINYIYENYLFLKEFFESNIPQIKIIKLEGTYLVWLDCKAMNLNDEDLNKFFIEKPKLGLNMGKMFGIGGEGFMRMNIAIPRSELEKALKSLEKAMK